MQLIASVAAVLGMAAVANAHMALTSPKPLGSPQNGGSDYDMTSPLDPSGSNFPCRGHLGLLGKAGGAVVDTWPAGSKQTLSINGGAWHSGGSCQASLSYDQGKTWTVIHSWEGSCPSGPGATSYDFAVPADAPAGDVLFGWTWFNKVGNREMYMNCAHITITASASKSKKRRGVAMSARPAMFVANVGKAGNGCSAAVEGKDLQFPDPGPDVTTNGNNFAPPGSNCPAAGAPAPRPQQPSSSSAAAPSASAPPAASSPSAPAPGNTQQPSSSSSVSRPGGVFVTVSESTGSATTAAPSAPAATNSVPAVPSAAPTAPSASEPAVPTPAPTGGNGGDSGFAVNSPCDDLGAWNCIGGTQWQRCASGNRWSATQPVAAGTKCKPGVSKVIAIY